MKRSYPIFAALLAGYFIGAVTPWADAHEEWECAPPPPCPVCEVCRVCDNDPNFVIVAGADEGKKADAIRAALDAIEAAEKPQLPQLESPQEAMAEEGGWEE